MDASYYAVAVQIGGRERSLVCNFRAVDQLTRMVGRNVLMGGNPFTDAEGALCEVSRIAEIMAIMLRWTEPDITVDALLDEMEMSKIPEYIEAVVHVMAGPNYSKQAPSENPLPATVPPQ